MTLEKQRRDEFRIILCIIAGLLISVNLRTFVHTGGLLPGGFSGLTLLIQSIFREFLGITIFYGPLYIFLNLFPIIISYFKIGKKFTIYSCITILLVAVVTDFIPEIVITYDILLISVFGGIVNGFAVILCLYAGATSGGTDFISIYISEKFGIDAWNYILIFNAVLLICDGFLFGWNKALYSIIFQFTSTQVINLGYKRYKKFTLFIVTDLPEEVVDVIDRLTNHGATEMDVMGTHKNTPRNMIYSVIDADELKLVEQAIKEVDPAAFINVVRTEQIQGRYYMRPND